MIIIGAAGLWCILILFRNRDAGAETEQLEKGLPGE